MGQIKIYSDTKLGKIIFEGSGAREKDIGSLEAVAHTSLSNKVVVRSLKKFKSKSISDHKVFFSKLDIGRIQNEAGQNLTEEPLSMNREEVISYLNSQFTIEVTEDYFRYSIDTDRLEATKAIKTTLNSFYLGDQHKISSTGENIAFTNLSSDIDFFPTWQGIRDQSKAENQNESGILLPTGRTYGGFIDADFYGGVGLEIIDYVSNIRDLNVNLSVYGIEFSPAETLIEGDYLFYSIYRYDSEEGETIRIYSQTIKITQEVLTEISTTGNIKFWFDHPTEMMAGADLNIYMKKGSNSSYNIDNPALKVHNTVMVGLEDKPYIKAKYRVFADKNILLEGDANNQEIVDNLDSIADDKALSANQGRILNEAIETNATAISNTPSIAQPLYYQREELTSDSSYVGTEQTGDKIISFPTTQTDAAGLYEVSGKLVMTSVSDSDGAWTDFVSLYVDGTQVGLTLANPKIVAIRSNSRYFVAFSFVEEMSANAVITIGYHTSTTDNEVTIAGVNVISGSSNIQSYIDLKQLPTSTMVIVNEAVQEIVDNLDSTAGDKALSANQGRELKEAIDVNSEAISNTPSIAQPLHYEKIALPVSQSYVPSPSSFEVVNFAEIKTVNSGLYEVSGKLEVQSINDTDGEWFDIIKISVDGEYKSLIRWDHDGLSLSSDASYSLMFTFVEEMPANATVTLEFKTSSEDGSADTITFGSDTFAQKSYVHLKQLPTSTMVVLNEDSTPAIAQPLLFKREKLISASQSFAVNTDTVVNFAEIKTVHKGLYKISGNLDYKSVTDDNGSFSDYVTLFINGTQKGLIQRIARQKDYIDNLLGSVLSVYSIPFSFVEELEADAIITIKVKSGATDAVGVQLAGGSTYLRTYVDLEQLPTSTLTLMPTPANTYNVDTFYAELGGYVIEINSDGTHGIVSAMQDQGDVSWYDANDLMSDASKHDTAGAKFKDWRLPTLRELQVLYTKNTQVGGFDIKYYWCSTAKDENYVFLKHFTTGAETHTARTSLRNVRAVRVF